MTVIWKICLIVATVLILSFFLVEIIERQDPNISDHTNYCYEMCGRMVSDRDSFYFDMDNGWTHCVEDCGGYD